MMSLARQYAAFLLGKSSGLHPSTSHLSNRGVSTSAVGPALRGKRASSITVYCNTQITSQARNGNIAAAESVFIRMPFKSTVSWTAMLTAFAENGQIERARQVFDEMPAKPTASYNAMITAYIRNSCNVNKAFHLFSKIPRPNAISYAAMVTGLIQAGEVDMAEKLHAETPVEWRDPVCSNALLNGYLKIGALDDAVRVFYCMIQRDVVSYSSVIDGYCKKGALVEARELFDKMPERNVITWTAMINGHLKMGLFEDGFVLFINMRRDGIVGVNSNTLTVMVEACTDSERFREGMQMHSLVFQLGYQADVFLSNCMINMYCRLGSTEAADKIFDALSRKDIVTWNSLIAGHARNGNIEKAYALFRNMPSKDIVSWTTLIAGFSTNGMAQESIKLFKMMPDKDDVAWTAIISSLVNDEEYEQAFQWFVSMLQADFRPNPLTLSSVLSGSAGLAALNQGLQIHAYALKILLEHDLSIQNSLVSMYSKCGSMMDACKVFAGTSAPNVVSYNSMICGLAGNGFGKEAIRVFKKVTEDGQIPNEVTFLGVLTACCHAGLVEEGWKHFKSMKSLYGIEVGQDHYACMVDLLGRAGLLKEAIGLVHSMPCEPHTGVWGALLSASKTYSRLDLAEVAARNLIKLQPNNAAPYVVLSSLYDALGKKYEGDCARMAKKSKGVRKSPGCSWIMVKDRVRTFVAGNELYLDMEGIEATLCTIAKDMKVQLLEILQIE